MKGFHGAISVFFALICAIIFALFLGILESARTAGARLSMQVAVNSSIDSLFSQYHDKLWKDYRLLGLEQYSLEQLSDEMADFLEPYLKAKNWFPASLKEITLEEAMFLTDENGRIYEEDVMDYMKFGIVATIWDDVEIKQNENSVQEGNALDDISDLYDGHAIDAVDVEEALEKVELGVKESEDKVSEAENSLKALDGGGFIDGAREAIDELNEIRGLVEDYVETADELQDELKKSRAELEAKKSEISDDVWQSLNEDISEYESYISEDGERRKKIEDLPDKAEDNISFLQDRISEAEEKLEQLDNYEFEDEEEKQSFWDPVINNMERYPHLEKGPDCGVAEKEQEKSLENLKELFSGPDMLNLVLPQGHEPENEALQIEDWPTKTSIGKSSKENNLGITDRVYMAFYNNAFFNYFGRGVQDLSEQDKTKGSGGCEQEYILYGGANDRENLKTTVKTLVVIRTGLNLAYLYTKDSVKKGQARTLALAIAGVAALTPLVTVIQFLILSVWAMAEAIVDVKNLLSGGKVPLIHDKAKGTFVLSYDALLRIIGGGSLEDEFSRNKETGLSYSDYLKILLFLGHDSDMDYRAMDMIERSLSKDQTDFDMDRCIYSLEADVHLEASHLFSELAFVKSLGGIAKNYNMSISTSYSY